MSTQQRLLKATNFAALAHGTQTRKNAQKLPYIVHPIDVAMTLSCEAQCDDVEVLQAALLHDVAEDTNVKIEQIEAEFGAPVASIVRQCTDDKLLSKYDRKCAQISNANKKSKQAALVKAADKLSNLRDLFRCPPSSWSRERIQGYFLWARAVVRNLTALKETASGLILLEKLNYLFEEINLPADESGSLLSAYLCSMAVVSD